MDTEETDMNEVVDYLKSGKGNSQSAQGFIVEMLSNFEFQHTGCMEWYQEREAKLRVLLKEAGIAVSDTTVVGLQSVELCYFRDPVMRELMTVFFEEPDLFEGSEEHVDDSDLKFAVVLPDEVYETITGDEKTMEAIEQMFVDCFAQGSRDTLEHFKTRAGLPLFITKNVSGANADCPVWKVDMTLRSVSFQANAEAHCDKCEKSVRSKLIYMMFIIYYRLKEKMAELSKAKAWMYTDVTFEDTVSGMLAAQ